MRILISEVRAAIKLRLYMPALIALFAIPDAAAAIEYPGEKPSQRYTRWYDSFVGKASGLEGATAWLARNALIHETAVNWHAAGLATNRLIIGIPDAARSGVVHGVGIEAASIAGRAGAIDLTLLSSAILEGAERWLGDAERDPDKRARIEGLLQVRPDGVEPYMTGRPLIA